MERQVSGNGICISTDREIGIIKGYIQPSQKSTLDDAASYLSEYRTVAESCVRNGCSQFKSGAEAYYNCGLWFVWAKEKMPHGTFMSWYGKLGWKPNTVRHCMRLVEKCYDRNNLVSGQTITRLLESAGIRKPELTRLDPDAPGKTRLPDCIERIALDFKRWKVADFDKRFDDANDALLCAWYESLKPMAEAFRRVEERLKR